MSKRKYYSSKAPKMDTRRVLMIPDQHAPYVHPDAIRFLSAVKRKFKPTSVVNLGDEMDKHAMSFHDSDPDLLSAADELKAGIKWLKRLEKLFPDMIVVDSNHGSMALRKTKHHGIPIGYLRTPQEIYGTKNWTWVEDLKFTLPNGQYVYVCHGKKKNGLVLTKAYGMCTVQGHFHSEFNIQYHSNPHNLLWSMQPGCLIDHKSMAFAYNKLTLARPILGCGMIIDSQPLLIPMILDKKGRWIGKLPGGLK